MLAIRGRVRASDGVMEVIEWTGAGVAPAHPANELTTALPEADAPAYVLVVSGFEAGAMQVRDEG